MKTVAPSMVLSLVFMAPTHAAETVVLGRAISQTGIEDVEVPCPDDHICMSGWVRWVIKVDSSISGQKLSGRIVAATLQHGYFKLASVKANRAFVVSPIDDIQQRKLLRADFYLVDKSPSHEVYCFSWQPKDVKEADVWFTEDGASRYCIERKESE